MSVLKEYRCRVHGTFESADDAPPCPHGCDLVDRVFLTPVGFGSERTRGIDRTLNSLAQTYKLPDIANRDGQPALRQTTSNEQRNEDFKRYLRERYGDGWGVVPKGGTMRADTKEITKEGGGPASALAQYHGAPENNFDHAREAFSPIPVSVKKDPENLQVTADAVRSAR